MTSDFNELLRSSAPVIPDPGDVRRLNRRDLKRSLIRRGRLRRLGSVGLVCSLALVFIVAGGVGNLGSDTFETTSVKDTGQDLQQLGIGKILRLGERGQPVPVIDGWTEDQARELAIQAYNDEGQLAEIKGWRATGVEIWAMGFRSEIGGDQAIRARKIQGMPEHITSEFLDFLSRKGSLIAENPEKALGGATRLEDITIEGVIRTFRVWTFSCPSLGEQVNYYLWEADR